MKAKDISSVKELVEFVNVEVAVQGMSRKIVAIELPEEWFFKFAKFIKHFLPSAEDLELECKKFLVKIDGVLTIVTRK